MFELLRTHPAFRNFWLAQVASQVGDRVHTLAVIWLVYSWTRSGTMLGVVMVASTLPAILVAPWAGYVADRANRRTIALVCDGVRAILVLSLAILAQTQQLNMPLLVGITALLSMTAAFFNPATLAMVPQLVKGEQLTQANALGQLSANASGALGFLAGSSLIALIGVPAAFLCNVVSFGLSAFFLLRMAWAHAPAAARTSVRHGLGQGWQTMRSVPVVLYLLGPLVVINFLFSSLMVLIPVFAEGQFASGPGGIGVLMAAYTGGMLLAALLLGQVRLRTSVATLLGGSLLLVVACFTAMGLWASLGLFLVALLLVGLALNGVNICLITLFQRLVPAHALGQFFSLLMALALSSQPLSFGVTGWLTDQLAPTTVLLGSAAALLLCAVYVFSVPALRQQRVGQD